jgi:DUF4097 and DUF4098 domain-containing protein YvlB
MSDSVKLLDAAAGYQPVANLLAAGDPDGVDVTMTSGTGNVRIGSVDGDVLVRSGSGDVSVGDAGAGTVELMTGSGEIRIGIRKGTLAELDVSSGAGTVTSELDVSDTAPDSGVALRVRARTGSGNAVVAGAES